MSESSVIGVKSLKVSFGAATLFEDLSFSIAAGEHVALTGPSGCGKSTVLRCLLGFVEPDCGEIRIGGERVNGKSVWQLRTRLAFVPQEADLGEGTAREFLVRPFSYRVNDALAGNVERIPELLAAVGLADALLDVSVDTLSGGEKQRIALVSALLLDRPILLVDEVTSALDKDSAERVCELLAGLRGKAIVGVVHEGERMPFATRRIPIGEGGIHGRS
jgi:putative ABC transport system ATP-binding protein